MSSKAGQDIRRLEYVAGRRHIRKSCRHRRYVARCAFNTVGWSHSGRPTRATTRALITFVGTEGTVLQKLICASSRAVWCLRDGLSATLKLEAILRGEYRSVKYVKARLASKAKHVTSGQIM